MLKIVSLSFFFGLLRNVSGILYEVDILEVVNYKKDGF